MAHTFYESASSDRPLIQALSTPEEVKRGQEFVSTQVSVRDAAHAPQTLHRLAVEHCQTAVGLLRQKGDCRSRELSALGAGDSPEGRQCCERRRVFGSRRGACQ